MFQTGLPFFVTSLLALEESMSTVYFVAMTALSLVFYVPVNFLTGKLGKKKLVLTAFFIFAAAFLYTAFLGNLLGIPAVVPGLHPGCGGRFSYGSVRYPAPGYGGRRGRV